MSDAQTIYVDAIFNITNQNGWDEAVLFGFAHEYMLQNTLLPGFYQYMLHHPAPPADLSDFTSYPYALEYFTDNSLLSDFYDYLETKS